MNKLIQITKIALLTIILADEVRKAKKINSRVTLLESQVNTLIKLTQF